MREWLLGRSPAAPARLARRIEDVLGVRGDAASTDASEQCIGAANELLRDLLGRPSAGRESALDLLTVDALVTYAFEAAAQDPGTLARRAGDAMRVLAATAH